MTNDITKWNVGGVSVDDTPPSGGESSGGGVLIGTTDSDNGSFIVDMPVAEVAAAMEKGAKICIHIDTGGATGCMIIEFSKWYTAGGVMRIMAYSVNVDITTEIDSYVGMADGDTTKFVMIPHS